MSGKSKFARLRKIAPTKRVWFVFNEIAGLPELEVCHAGQTNPGFFEALLKETAKASRALHAGASDEEAMEVVKKREVEALQRDRELYPKFVITGFRQKAESGEYVEGLFADEGELVPFSADNAKDFVDQLPDFAMNRLRRYCDNVLNFVDQGTPTAEEKKVLSGN